MKTIFLLDWGNTLMRDFPDENGVMYLWSKVEAMPGAEAMLKALSRKGRCYVATNAKDSMKADIEKALVRGGLYKYFVDIFCYREIGFAKPSADYFNTIIERLKCKPSDMLMIGDSIEADIEGAEESGIEGILYDPENIFTQYSGKRVSNLADVSSMI